MERAGQDREPAANRRDVRARARIKQSNGLRVVATVDRDEKVDAAVAVYVHADDRDPAEIGGTRRIVDAQAKRDSVIRRARRAVRVVRGIK